MTQPDSESSSAPRWNRQQLVCRRCACVLLVLVLYFASYGPAVLRAVNNYGQIGPRKEKFLRTIYAPAAWLAEHWDIYHDYRHFWVRHSRNYEWWLERKGWADKSSPGNLVPPVD